MAILAECPGCRKKQSIKNKICSCGENLDKAKQSKRVKYWIDYRLKDGSHNRESLAKFDDVNPYSIEAAKAVLSKRVVQKKEKRIFDIQPEANMTFKELSEWYLENGYQKVHRGMVNKHPEVFEANIKKFNLKFGNLTVSQITAADIQQYQNGRTIAKLRPGTIDLEVGAARAVVNKAFLARKVTQDIVLEFKQVPRLLVRGSNIRKVIVSPEHYEKIYKVIAERSKPIWKILSYEGMREGEVLGLTPDKISLDRHLIKLGAEDTKEKKEKIVPMEDEVYLIISARVNELANQKATGNAKLFNLTKEQFMYDVKKAHKATGLPYGRFNSEGVTSHSLRHTWKTDAVRANVPKAYRKALQGHSTDEMDDRYTHLGDKDLISAMKRITDFRNGKFEGMGDDRTILEAILKELQEMKKNVYQNVDQAKGVDKKELANPLN